MDKVNPSQLGDEWQYLLQAYLAGAFGDDPEFQEQVGQYFRKMLVQTEATTADFSKRFSDRAYQYADTYLHTTKETFAYLQGTCKDYPQLMETLSNAEKNAVIAQYYGSLLDEQEEEAQEITQRVENVLYALVNDYDEEEMKVVKEIKRNEYIIAAEGDETAAQRKFDAEFPGAKRQTFGDLMAKWAFTEDSALTPVSVRKFSISFTKDWILRGYQKFAENYRSTEKDAYTFDIDGCEITCTENDYAAGEDAIESYYEKNRWKNILSDKFTLIYALVALAGLTALIIMGFQLSQGHFSPVALTLGILLVLLGVFLLWRQIVAVLEKLKEQKRLGIQRFRHALDELGEWRSLYHQADDQLADLEDALNRFGSGEE